MTLDEMYAEDQRLKDEINKLTAQRHELANQIERHLIQTAKQAKVLRRRMGISQRAFADLVGVSFLTVCRWEKGQSKPGIFANARITEIAKTVAVED